MTIYERIKDLRISKKMTQTDLALMMGYKDGSMITKIESGKVDISQKKIVAFAKALGTTPGYLMGWNSNPYNCPNARPIVNDPGEERLISDYRSLSPRGKELLHDRCEELKLLYGKKSEDSPAESV